MLLRFGILPKFPHVATYLGMVLRLIAAMLLVPLAVSLVVREFDFSLSFGATLAGAGIVGWLLGRKRPSRLGRREAIVVTALAYPLFASLGGLALLPGVPYLDGLFETMSGLTTTGLTVLSFDHTPTTMLYFRAYTQWIGGIGIIVLSIAVLLSTAGSSLQLFASEYGEDNVAGNVVATTKAMVRVYAGMTVAAVLLLLAVGMSPADAVLHGLTGISTGGFSPYLESISHFDSNAIRIALIVIMVAGAISFPLYYLAVMRNGWVILRDSQVRTLLLLAVAASIVFVTAGPWSFTDVVASTFNAVSALSGTGFSIGDPVAWHPGPFGLAIVLMAIGGASGSTTGGIKQYRLGVAAKAVAHAASQSSLPEHAKVPLRYNREVVVEAELTAVLAVLAMYVGVLVVSGVALTFAGASVGSAFFEASSAVGTVGLSSGITGPHAAEWVKGILIVDMWAGRLEMIPIAVLLANAQLFLRRRMS